MNTLKIDKGILIFIGILIGLSIAVGFIAISKNKQAATIQQPVEKLAPTTPKKPLEVIDYYYSLLSSGKLKEAYAMHQKPKVSFEQFEKWYKDIVSAYPNTWNAEKIKENTYRFLVDISFHDSYKQPKEEYQVIMGVNDGKVDTISSKQISGAQAIFGNLSASLNRDKNGKVFIVLKKDNTIENITENFKDDPGYNELLGLYSGDLQFSPKGNYLIYALFGDSAPFLKYIYSINTRKQMRLESPFWFEFTPDEKYLLACAYREMDPVAYGNVYQLPDFKLKYNLLADPKINPDGYKIKEEEGGPYMMIGNFNCEYNDKKSAVKFTITGMYDKDGSWNSDAKKEVEYFLKTGEVKY